MAGILDKKSRLIDYKLTENGRRQLSQGDIRFKYFTFSDRSIVYHSYKKDGIDISNSNSFYLPLEVSTDPGIYYNSEYFLSNELTFVNSNDHIFNLQSNTKSLSEMLQNQSILTNKKITNSGKTSNNITFRNKDIQQEFNFQNQNFCRRYPTVKFHEENIENISNVRKDLRFSNHIKNKKLVPLNGENQELVDNNESLVPSESLINYIFKTLDVENNIVLSERSETIVQAVNSLEENLESFFRMTYEIDSSFYSSQDSFVFEIHEIREEDKLYKLPFVNLGSFFDKSKNRFLNIYLVGKFIKNNKLSEFVNIENNTTVVNNINDYHFVNLFTLVVE